ncbi:MAG: hypothetical protein H0T93_02130, partial [Chloroflexia bacterium]|nr:hypothetical protein [Chloroflexia bacterium]
MDIANRARVADSAARLPRHLVAGLALLAIAWPLAWFGSAPYASYTFFPLWLGYILTVDGLTAWRTGTSLLTRSGHRFVALFGFSLPLWWFFEFANQFLGNWRYQLPRDYSPIVYFLLASVAFSTVMPAIFVTAEFYRGFRPFAPARRWIQFAPSRSRLAGIAILGLAMFIASLVFPDVAFPLVWIGLFLTVDAVNALTGSKSLAAQVADGRWDTVLVLFAAGLTCGFFWEMWNYWSMPKWIYHVPVAGWFKLFEMPILGFGGYLPFALEIYA